MDADRSDALWAGRPRDAQLQVIAFEQSAAVPSRRWLVTRLAQVSTENSDAVLPRPAGWGGYTLVVERIQFWARGDDRIPDRHDYRLNRGMWSVRRLAP